MLFRSYDPYVRLLNVQVQDVPVDPATSPLPMAVRVADNVNGSSGNPSIRLTTVTFGAPPSPSVLANGDVLLVELTLSNTTAY